MIKLLKNLREELKMTELEHKFITLLGLVLFFFVGLLNLLSGDIGRFDYFIVWFLFMVMLFGYYMEMREDEKEEKKAKTFLEYDYIIFNEDGTIYDPEKELQKELKEIMSLRSSRHIIELMRKHGFFSSREFIAHLEKRLKEDE